MQQIHVFVFFLREQPLFITLLRFFFLTPAQQFEFISTTDIVSFFFCDVSAVSRERMVQGGDREPRYGCQPQASPRVDVDEAPICGQLQKAELVCCAVVLANLMQATIGISFSFDSNDFSLSLPKAQCDERNSVGFVEKRLRDQIVFIFPIRVNCSLWYSARNP